MVSDYVGKRVADIGCGLSFFSEIFDHTELYLVFDNDESIKHELKKSAGTGKFTIARTGDICSDEAVQELIDNDIDTIICFNTLEHISDDKTAMANMVRGVREHGHICIIVPALNILYGTLDVFDGHYRRYSKKSLLGLIENLPVRVELLHYMNMIGGIGWFIKSRILKEKSFKTENFKIISTLVPVISSSERRIKPPFGLSLVLVLKKLHD